MHTVRSSMKPLWILKMMLIVLIFVFAGKYLISPGQYLSLLPVNMPGKLWIIYATGLLYMSIGVLLFARQYRAVAKLAIGTMLLGLCLMSIPRLFEFYLDENRHLLVSLLRITTQIMFIATVWALLQRSPQQSH